MSAPASGDAVPDVDGDEEVAVFASSTGHGVFHRPDPDDDRTCDHVDGRGDIRRVERRSYPNRRPCKPCYGHQEPYRNSERTCPLCGERCHHLASHLSRTCEAATPEATEP
jgi:hypothetical protein